MDAAEPYDPIVVERARIDQERGSSVVLRAVRRSSGRELYRSQGGILGDWYASDVLAYPDFDGDGCEDLVVSTRSIETDDFTPGPTIGRESQPRIELCSGRTGRLLRCLELDAAVPNNAWATCLTGDVDRDGWPDVCASAFGEYRPGRLHLLSLVEERTLWSIEGVHSEPWTTLAFGSCLASGADVNHDGTLDIAVGAGESSWDATGPMYGDPGAVFVYSGIDGSLISTVHGL